MTNQWFRMYHEFATDPKIQMLSEADQRRYVMLLCLRCSNGDVTLHDNEVAFQLRVTEDDWAATKEVLLAKRLIDKDNKPTAWDKRQYVSDSSRARVAKHRAKKKKECNVTVTPPDTDTDTDTDTDIKKENTKRKKSTPSGADPTASKNITKTDLVKKYNVDPKVAEDYLSVRRAKRMPLTETAFDGLVKQFEDAGLDVRAGIKICASESWAGFNPKWSRKNASNDKYSGFDKTDYQGQAEAEGFRTDIAL